MSESLLSVRPSLGTWNRGALHVEYGFGVLEEIRRTVQEGFHKIPHGGVETGGLLYGKWDGAVLTIAAWRPMHCEHPLGPRFQLSGADEVALADQLAVTPTELDEYQVVGWFASHSRGALQLRGPDVDLHAKFFPEPWQPILLLCVSRNQPMQAAFYSRLDATLAPGAEVQGFEVIPNPTAVPRRARRTPAPMEGHGLPAQLPVNDSIRILASRVGAEPVETAAITPANGRPPRGYERVESADTELIVSSIPAASGALGEAGPAANHALEQPLEQAAAQEDAPKFTVPLEGRALPWKKMAWAALWVAIAAGGVYAIPRYVAAAPVTAVEVQMHEVSGATPGQVAIRWDVKADTTQTLRGGELTVSDGRQERHFTLTGDELRAGALTYWRESNDLGARVTIQTAAGEMVGVARFALPAASRPGTEDPGMGALRQQLKQERQRGRQLERQLSLAGRK